MDAHSTKKLIAEARSRKKERERVEAAALAKAKADRREAESRKKEREKAEAEELARKEAAMRDAEQLLFRVLDRAFRQATLGARRFKCEIWIDAKDHEFNEVQAAAVELLHQHGFMAEFHEQGLLEISWEGVNWEHGLAGPLNPWHIAWISSASGQGLLQAIFDAIGRAAVADRKSVRFLLQPILRNEIRWGPNDVYKVTYGRRPIGVLPCRPTLLTKALRQQGLAARFETNRSGSAYVHVSW